MGARAEPEVMAVLAPTAGWRELLEAQLRRATQAGAGLLCLRGQEDMPRGDRREQVVADGGGPRPVPPQKRRPIQVLEPLEEVPNIIADSMARDQRPMLEEEVNTSEIDERAPYFSAVTAARGTSSGGDQGHELFVERDRCISSWTTTLIPERYEK